MRRIYGLLISVVFIQLTVSVGMASAKIFPEAPTRAYGNGWINQIVYSPAGERLAVSGRDGIWLYDASTLTEVAHFAADLGRINTIATSPDGQWLASGGFDGLARLWEMATGQEVATFAGHTYAVNSVNFSPDGALLASSSSDGTLYLWDVQKREQVADFGYVIRRAGEQPRNALFSPDGRYIAVAGSWGKILIFDLETQALIHTLDHQAIWPAIAFSADGKTLFSIAVANLTADVKFWDVDTGEQIDVIKDIQSSVLIATPNRNQMVFWGWNSPIRLWDIVAKVEVAQFPVNGGVSSLSFHPAGDRFAIISNSTTIQIWDVATRKPTIQKETHTGGVSSVVISPDGESFATLHSDDTVRLWDVGQGVELKRWAGRGLDFRTLDFSPNGELLVVADGDAVRILDATKWRERVNFAFQGPKRAVFSPDSKRIYAVNDEHEILGWDIDSEKRVLNVQGEEVGFRGEAGLFAISPDGKFLASAGNALKKNIFIWNVDERKVDLVLRGHERGASSFTFSPDGRILVSADGSNLFFWDIQKNEKIASYPVPARLLTFSPDGGYLLWETPVLGQIYQGKITAFQWKDREVVDSLTFNLPGYDRNFSFSRDGKRLITHGEKIELWDVDLASPVAPAKIQPTLWGQVKRTALLPNFPNPFNPDTWIPYQLAAPSDVTLTIYDAKGQHIRTLALGEKSTGIYRAKADAIHWDGRNDVGELLPSGVYFYHLQAGAYHESGKMLLLK